MKQRKAIIRNGVVIYQPRKDQLRELSLDDFRKELKKEHRSFNLKKSIKKGK